MEKELGTEEKLTSRDPNGEIEIEKQESVQLNQDTGLRSRNSFKRSLTIEIPKIKVGSTTVSPEKTKTPKVTTPRTPLEYGNDDDDHTVFKQDYQTRKRSKKITLLFVIEFTLFVCITLVLILSKFTRKLKKREIWSLKLWELCVLAMAIFCGRMFSKWLIHIIVLLIETEFLLKKNALYFVYAAQKSIRVFIWLGLILLSWGLLVNRGVHRSEVTDHITRGIACTLVVIGAWVTRTMLVKKLYSSFYEARYFSRIQENIFHGYILQILASPPLMKGSKKTETVIDVKNLQKIKRGKVSAWTMRGVIKVVKSGLCIPSNELDEYNESADRCINSEWEAKAAGYAIFKNVAKHGHKYIEEDDLLHFIHKDEVKEVFALMRRAAGEVETGRIKRKSVTNWVVKTYMKRKLLAFSLSDAKAEIKFSHLAKSTIEAIIFVFMRHPFDAGDRCVIDGVQVVVEEMNLLTTVVLRYDNEKIYYANSVLATKPISNFNRSPEMSDFVEFDLDVFTSVEKISALKVIIKTYINSKPHLWHPKHSVRVREIEDGNKMKMRLYITHTINFQDHEEKSDRRSELVLELKKILEELEIKYHIG